MSAGHPETIRPAMKLLGLEFPVPSHSVAANHVLGAAAVTIGFGIGSWLLGTPLDRPGAIALFVGCLYIKLADPFLAMKDEKRKRYAVAAGGAGILIASAALVEQFAIF